MDDNAMICGNCGTPLGGDVQTKDFKYADPEKKAKTQKIVKLGLTAIIAVIVIAILGSILSSFTGYRGTVRKFMKAYKDEDATAMVDMSCSFLQDEDFYEYTEYKYNSMLENDYDSFDNYFDSKYSIKYEIGTKKKLSDRQIKNEVENLLQAVIYDYSDYEDEAAHIKKVITVKVTITAKHGSQKTPIEKTLFLGKESGKWKLLTVF